MGAGAQAARAALLEAHREVGPNSDVPREHRQGRARTLAQQLGRGRRVAAQRQTPVAAGHNTTTTTAPEEPAAVAHLVLGVADAAVAGRLTAGPALAAAADAAGPPNDAGSRAAGVGLVLRRRRRRRAAAFP